MGIAAGDESAFRHLFDAYYQLLVTFAFRFLNDLDSSRNVVQDVFVSLYDKRESISIHTSLKAHLYQSVRNRALNVLKRDKMQREHHHRIFEEQSEGDAYEEISGVDEMQNRIAKVVDALPPQCQKIFIMSRRDGVANGEIADQLSISKRTVETQISKALKKIRKDLLIHGFLSLVGSVIALDALIRIILK
ncbi:RNA polymerase sigma-70 factor [Marinilabilia salmonicolor]|uniref:RNA polymerase sigma-70 factor n=1 Tax=Marinilabilia salmonicolor TaxID=989 RepID=UPI00029A63BC|nr:RNA polymerase sigma-70 factor [Marinilabilia salmonicolor]